MFFILSWIFLFVFLYLAISTVYLLFFSIAGRFFSTRSYSSHPDKARIAVFIPSYKEDNIIVQTAREAVEQDYPRDRFSVNVIADSLQPETIAALRAIPVRVIEVSFEKSMKAKSLNQALNQVAPEGYELAMILDADNHMAPGCLEKVNHSYRSGWKVIQCHRTAKNKNTSVAILDAASEEINNTIFRKGHRVAGLSCTLIGSGMAFEYDLLKEIFSLPEIQNNPGEDREVDIQLVKKKLLVEYIEDAYVYDEKVQRKEVFEKQRTRWLGTQVEQLQRFLRKDLLGQGYGITFVNKFFQNFLLPRLLMLALTFFLAVLTLAFHILGWQISLPDWRGFAILFGVFLLTLLIAVPTSFYTRETLKAILSIPGLVFSMIKALLKIGNNKKGFIHTPKEFSSK